MDKTRYCKECFDRQEKIEQLEIELRVAKSQLEQIKTLVKEWNYLSDLEAREDILSIIEGKEDENTL